MKNAINAENSTFDSNIFEIVKNSQQSLNGKLKKSHTEKVFTHIFAYSIYFAHILKNTHRNIIKDIF